MDFGNELKFYLKTAARKNSLLYKLFNMFRYDKDKKIREKLVISIQNIIFHNGIYIFENEISAASLFPKLLLDKTLELVNPKSVLDLGCGTGKSLDCFVSKGLEAKGVEGSALAISQAKHPELILKFNLNKKLNLNRKFDLIWSFEFVEHIHPKYVNNLMNTFSNHSDNVVMSAARPGQGGSRHFNEQEDEYWINQFSKHGYTLNEAKTKILRSLGTQYSQNMYDFERK